jgi:hypothetical protein
MEILGLYLQPEAVNYGYPNPTEPLKESYLSVRFQVLTVASMKIRAFWDIAPCGLLGVDLRFRDAYCLHHQGDDGGNTHL